MSLDAMYHELAIQVESFWNHIMLANAILVKGKGMEAQFLPVFGVFMDGAIEAMSSVNQCMTDIVNESLTLSEVLYNGTMGGINQEPESGETNNQGIPSGSQRVSLTGEEEVQGKGRRTSGLNIEDNSNTPT